MAGSFLEITANTPEISAALAQLAAVMNDLTPAFRDIGESLLNSSRERFRTSTAPDGSRWLPLKPATLAARARAAGGSYKKGINRGRYKKRAAQAVATAKPLIFSGALFGTLNYRATKDSVRVGTPLEYGATHQYGRGHIPARPFLGLSRNDETEVVAILNDYLAAHLPGGH